MLSICIPIYNYRVIELANELLKQIGKNNFLAEIILIDDASKIEFRQTNERLSNSNQVKYVQLEENIGRSRIRNLFLKHSSFDYLLFLDCDVRVENEDFLESYISEIKKNKQVICGGISYDEKRPLTQFQLRWKYGHLRESLSVETRSSKPYKSFMTGNFTVSKNILQEIRFNERISTYGHEDTVFGFRLKQKEIIIKHINNPVKHDISETNIEFIQKTEQSLKNLVKIRIFINDKGFDNELKILRTYQQISFYGIRFFLPICYNVIGPVILWLLKKHFVSIYLFDIYKLLYFSKLIK